MIVFKMNYWCLLFYWYFTGNVTALYCNTSVLVLYCVQKKQVLFILGCQAQSKPKLN